MAGKTGNEKIIEQFLADGMDVMFGNPGTVEQGFLDALRLYPDMKYVLTLQESIAVLMADGHARATQKPTLVQLHSSPGIGNAVGALYQAKRGHSPLVVIGGDSGVKYMNMDAQMANDLVGMMEPVTKYATVVMEPRSLLRTLRRAIKIAATPPMGPVYVCLPMDMLDTVTDEAVRPTVIPSTRVTPEQDVIDEIASSLLNAKNPRFFVGDGVAYSQGTEELTELAELIGAEVRGVEFGDFIMDNTHPLYAGNTGHMFGSHSKQFTEVADVNFVVGTYMLPDVFPELGEIYASDAKVIHVDLNTYEIAKNHRVDLAVASDPKLTLARVIDAVKTARTDEQAQTATARIETARTAKDQALKEQIEADEQADRSSHILMPAFTKVLAEKTTAGLCHL